MSGEGVNTDSKGDCGLTDLSVCQGEGGSKVYQIDNQRGIRLSCSHNSQNLERKQDGPGKSSGKLIISFLHTFYEERI